MLSLFLLVYSYVFKRKSKKNCDESRSRYWFCLRQKLSSYTTISIETLPDAQNQRLGGRQTLSLYLVGLWNPADIVEA